MPMDPSAVGKQFGPLERSWTSKDCLLYALGVGAGTEDLPFTTENSIGIDQQVLPTYGVLIGMAPASPREAGSFNPAMLVHAEQAIELTRPLPPEGTLHVTGRLAGIYDKGSGALVVNEGEGRTADGELVTTVRTSFFIRGEGGFGGDRGPAGDAPAAPEREPDDVVTSTTRPDQALLYRLSGDRNPLHSDPQFAAKAGFDRPILHGLCTYGFTGRALLQSLCGNDPARFRSMSGRFSKPVYPGDELRVEVWRTGDGQAVFRTLTQRGDVVIDRGQAAFTA